MSQSETLLNTQDFAKKAGVSAGTVSKWLRSGKIKGDKQGGKWMIAASELEILKGSTPSQSPKTTVGKPKIEDQPTKSVGHSYSIEEFSAMTYLTEFGVKKWIKEGKLSIHRDEDGPPRIDAANLDSPNVKRLLRH
jgi:hypothetical protein